MVYSEFKKYVHPKKKTEFMKIITFKAKIANIFKSFADYFPIIFEDSDYGLLNINFFNILFGTFNIFHAKIKFKSYLVIFAAIINYFFICITNIIYMFSHE